jgi:hypothetical protein
MTTKNQIEVKKFITPEVEKKLTTWEKEFITSIYKRKSEWTEKQLEAFNNIKKKLVNLVYFLEKLSQECRKSVARVSQLFSSNLSIIH